MTHRASRRADVKSKAPVARMRLMPLGAGLLAVFVLGCTRGDSGGPSGGSMSSDSAAALGRTVYQTNCATCHGTKGEGQPGWKSRKADGTYLPPPHDSTGHTWHHSDRQLLDVIRRGGDAAYGSPGFTSGMPAWSGRLSDQEITAVLVYIKTLWGPAERDSQARMSSQEN